MSRAIVAACICAIIAGQGALAAPSRKLLQQDEDAQPLAVLLDHTLGSEVRWRRRAAPARQRQRACTLLPPAPPPPPPPPPPKKKQVVTDLSQAAATGAQQAGELLQSLAAHLEDVLSASLTPRRACACVAAVSGMPELAPAICRGLDQAYLASLGQDDCRAYRLFTALAAPAPA